MSCADHPLHRRSRRALTLALAAALLALTVLVGDHTADAAGLPARSARVQARELHIRPLADPQAAVRNALNRDRQRNRLRPLPSQRDAQLKAQAWAERLAADGYLHHSTIPDGIRTRWCSLGENIGYGSGINAIEAAYMRSPHHRPNILGTQWNGVGVGYAKRGDRIYTVQVFIRTC